MKHNSSRSGAALVVTLSLIILLTVCILAFMAVVRSDRQSASLTAATTRAEILARSAGNVVLADLVSEIRDGSTNLGTASAVSFRANTNQNMLPQRVLADTNMAANTNFANLFKQSVPGAFYSGVNFSSNGPVRASGVGTWVASRNGRVLSAERWNKPALVFGSGFSSTNELPRWIYITRQETTGPELNPTNWSTNLSVANATNRDFVIGRAAYNIYEIGGCLDINVAGRIAGTSKSQFMASLAGAELAGLPGLTNSTSLTAWRNANTNQFLDYATNTGLKAGFLEKPAGDRRFVGRQDLIAYARENTGGGISTNALPYLTHFSRGLDRPSAQGTSNTNVYTGYPARPSTIDRAPLTLRYASQPAAFEDKTQLSAGDPVAFRRFPLRRLDLVRDNATAQKNDSDPIYRAFGLYRNNSTQPWTYNHGAADAVLTLKDVSDLPTKREPDFFEMLQAAIKSGSLGTSAGLTTVLNPSASATTYEGKGYAFNTRALDENIYRHILQIGANLIDQYDADDIPTNIKINANGSAINVYGVENLPYINEVFPVPYRPKAPPREEVRGYLQFEMWNPHQNAVTQFGNQNIRVGVIAGQLALDLSCKNPNLPAHTYWSGFTAPFRGLDAPTRVRGTKTTTVNFLTAPGYLTFVNNVSRFSEPVLLVAPGGPTGSSVSVSTATPADYIVEEDSAELAKSRSFDVKLAGILFDKENAPDDYVDGIKDGLNFGGGDAAKPYFCYNYAGFAVLSNLTIVAQVEVASGDWRTYQELPNIREVADFGIVTYNAVPPTFLAPRNNSSFTPAYPGGDKSMRAQDPRVSRFTWNNADSGGPGGSIRGTTTTFSQPGGGSALDGPGWVNPGALYNNSIRYIYALLAANIDNNPQALGNPQTEGPYYFDPDKVLRRADGEERGQVGSTPIALSNRVFPLVKVANGGNILDRPLILNRPFQSVADMGYTFRDVHWKTLDFWTENSGDHELLDYFTIDEPQIDSKHRQPLRAGVLNPNTASEAVLAAVIQGVVPGERSGLAIPSDKANAIAHAVRGILSANPMTSIGELSRAADAEAFFQSPIMTFRKTEKEAFVRALGGVTDVNTWNVMIDIVAQSGRLVPSATSLDDFAVQGEAHYWISAAIDRTTGKVIDIQEELVNE